MDWAIFAGSNTICLVVMGPVFRVWTYITYTIWGQISLPEGKENIQMPLKLIATNPSDEDMRKLILYVDPETQEPFPLDKEGQPIGEGWEAITFYLAQIGSGVYNRLQDEMFTFRKDGSSVMLAGSSIARKMKVAVKKWEGVVDSHGTPAPITDKALDLLPIWVQNKVIEEINKVNNLSQESELD